MHALDFATRVGKESLCWRLCYGTIGHEKAAEAGKTMTEKPFSARLERGVHTCDFVTAPVDWAMKTFPLRGEVDCCRN